MQHNPRKVKGTAKGAPQKAYTPAQIMKMRTIVQRYDSTRPNRLGLTVGIPQGCKVLFMNARRIIVVTLAIIGLCAIVTVCALTYTPETSTDNPQPIPTLARLDR